VATVDKWLNHPTAVKLMALTIGIIMWAVVHFEPDTSPNNTASLIATKTIDGVIVEPFGLDERNFVLLGIEPLTVKLTVKGVRSDMRTAGKEDYKLQVDLRAVGEGTHTLPVRVENLPRGVEFVEMSSGSVTVIVEALQTKEFEVDIRTQGSPAEGYITGTPIVKPTNRVHVTLPKHTLAQVSRVGAVLKVDGQTSVIKNKSVKLAVFDESGKVIEGAFIDPAVVEVEVPITNPFKTVPLQFVMTGQMPPGLSIGNFEPDVEQVTVYGPKEALDSIDFIEADLQLNKLSKSGKVTIPLPISGSITQISPAEVNVNVEVVLSDTRSLEGLPINWRGLGQGLSVKVVEPATGKADIKVKGSPARLGRLQPGDVTVDADLTGKGPGTHTVQLIVNSPRFIEQSGGTSTVIIEITADVPASSDAVQPADPSASPKGTDGGVSGGSTNAGSAGTP
jgi:YbbR domain-containing protein